MLRMYFGCCCCLYRAWNTPKDSIEICSTYFEHFEHRNGTYTVVWDLTHHATTTSRPHEKSRINTNTEITFCPPILFIEEIKSCLLLASFSSTACFLLFCWSKTFAPRPNSDLWIKNGQDRYYSGLLSISILARRNCFFLLNFFRLLNSIDFRWINREIHGTKFVMHNKMTEKWSAR